MFFYQPRVKQFLAVFVTLFIVACSDGGYSADRGPDAEQVANLPVLDVYKTATCGCCGKWIAHLEEHGFHAVTHNHNNLSALKSRHGIKPSYQSCHTAISKDGYVFEGHIPARYIQQFLEEKPAGAIGLSVPGMPLGSPGMEVGNRFSPYEVLLLKIDGSVETYVQVNLPEEQS
jgi:hypothetical protein